MFYGYLESLQVHGYLPPNPKHRSACKWQVHKGFGRTQQGIRVSLSGTGWNKESNKAQLHVNPHIKVNILMVNIPIWKSIDSFEQSTKYKECLTFIQLHLSGILHLGCEHDISWWEGCCCVPMRNNLLRTLRTEDPEDLGPLVLSRELLLIGRLEATSTFSWHQFFWPNLIDPEFHPRNHPLAPCISKQNSLDSDCQTYSVSLATPKQLGLFSSMII
jgi:hypothetical protein